MSIRYAHPQLLSVGQVTHACKRRLFQRKAITPAARASGPRTQKMKSRETPKLAAMPALPRVKPAKPSKGAAQQAAQANPIPIRVFIFITDALAVCNRRTGFYNLK
jgi:hypothetical protein